MSNITIDDILQQEQNYQTYRLSQEKMMDMINRKYENLKRNFINLLYRKRSYAVPLIQPKEAMIFFTYLKQVGALLKGTYTQFNPQAFTSSNSSLLFAQTLSKRLSSLRGPLTPVDTQIKGKQLVLTKAPQISKAMAQISQRKLPNNDKNGWSQDYLQALRDKFGQSLESVGRSMEAIAGKVNSVSYDTYDKLPALHDAVVVIQSFLNIIANVLMQLKNVVVAIHFV